MIRRLKPGLAVRPHGRIALLRSLIWCQAMHSQLMQMCHILRACTCARLELSAQRVHRGAAARAA
jgi:hypothetical protein